MSRSNIYGRDLALRQAIAVELEDGVSSDSLEEDTDVGRRSIFDSQLLRTSQRHIILYYSDKRKRYFITPTS